MDPQNLTAISDTSLQTELHVLAKHYPYFYSHQKPSQQTAAEQ